MARPTSAAKAGFYPTPPKALDQILQALWPTVTYSTYATTDHYRILDPCCGEGAALHAIAEHIKDRGRLQVASYGVELNQERSRIAATLLDNVMQADLFFTSIANDSFGLLFLNPPYDDQENEDDNTKIRTEFAFLQRCTQYLDKNMGVLVLIVQHKFLTPRTIRFLTTHYHTIRAIHFPEEERDQFGQITIMAHRKTEPYQDPQEEEYIARWAAQPPKNDILPPFKIHPANQRQVYFVNTFHDPWETAQEASASGIWNSPDFKDMLDPPHTARTRPLVPLRQGHIALLTAAGFLDDRELIDQHGTKVLVKGNIEKPPVIVENSPDKIVRQERLQITITALDLQTGEFHDIRP